MTHRTPSWNATDYSRSCISIRRSATRASHDSRRGRRNDLPLALSVFKLWIGRKTEDHAFTAVAGDDPCGGGHRKRLGEVVAKVKPEAILYYGRVNPEPDLTAAITAEIERAIRTLGGNPDTLDRHLAGKSDTGISGSRHLPAGDGRVMGRYIAGRRNSGRLANLECGQIPGAGDLIRKAATEIRAKTTAEGYRPFCLPQDTTAQYTSATPITAKERWRILQHLRNPFSRSLSERFSGRSGSEPKPVAAIFQSLRLGFRMRNRQSLRSRYSSRQAL
jgi:hypothetical protein